MNRRKFVSGLLIGLIIFLIVLILSYFFNFHFKLFLSLFLINFALLFFFKFLKIIKKPSEESFSKRTLKFLIVYGIPLFILGYVLYFNFLPFGFDKIYILDVGTTEDTNIDNEIYLEKTNDLSETREDEKGVTYRELKGVTSIISQPKAILKNPFIEVNIEGEGVLIMPPKIEFNPDDYELDLNLDFSKGIPEFLKGNAEFIDGYAYFNNQSKLVYPNTQNKFEDGPFMVYVEWTPENKEDNLQEIVGHYNWEIWQERDRIQFGIGRTDNASGNFHFIELPIEESFFNNKHTALAIYSPFREKESGYIELFVDNKFVKREYIGEEKIWVDYGESSLSIGGSKHGGAKDYIGKIHKVKILKDKTEFLTKNISFKVTGEVIPKIYLVGYGKIEKINFHIEE